MYKIKDENVQMLEKAFELLNMIEVKGLQSVNALGSSSSLLRQFYESMEKIEEEIIIDNTKEDKK